MKPSIQTVFSLATPKASFIPAQGAALGMARVFCSRPSACFIFRSFGQVLKQADGLPENNATTSQGFALGWYESGRWPEGNLFAFLPQPA